MQFNKFTDLGLRVLVVLCRKEAQDRVTIEQVADELRASKNHLIKIVHFMSKSGWVQSFKGRTGGIRIDEQVYKVPLGELIRSLENHSSESRFLIDCGALQCSLIPICGLPAFLDEALETFYASLNRHALKDILRENNMGSFPAGARHIIPESSSISGN